MLDCSKVSIVLPVYNVERYLRECLESALAQTLREIEIICVDDGSTDSSPAILAEYAARDNRVHIIRQSNQGYGRAVNVGMDAAHGEYIAILESDDFIDARMYECLYDLAQRHDVDVVKADFQRFSGEAGNYRKVYANIASKELYGCVIENEPARVLKNAALYNWSGIYRKDFLVKNQICYNETPGASYQDNGFWFQSMALAQRVYFHNEAFYMLRRDNPDSSIHSKEKAYCIRDEYEFILEFLTKQPQIYNDLIGVYWWARFSNYQFNYRRIKPLYKADFARHFSEIVQQAAKKDEIDWNLLSTRQAKEVRSLLSGWQRYHCLNRFRKIRDPMKESMLHHIIWSIEDNGVMYTVKHAANKIAVTLRDVSGDYRK